MKPSIGLIKVKTMSEKKAGVVKWFNRKKGFGFIVADDGGNDIFVHYSGIKVEPGAFATLDEGDEVEYELQQGQKGMEAKDVVIKKKAPRKQPEHGNRGFGGPRDAGGFSRGRRDD